MARKLCDKYPMALWKKIRFPTPKLGIQLGHSGGGEEVLSTLRVSNQLVCIWTPLL